MRRSGRARIRALQGVTYAGVCLVLLLAAPAAADQQATTCVRVRHEVICID